MTTISDDLLKVRTLLRRACRQWPSGVALPDSVARWWAEEQTLIEQERVLAAAKKAAEVEALTAEIARLNARLAELQAS